MFGTFNFPHTKQFSRQSCLWETASGSQILLGLVQNRQHPISLRLLLLAVQANRPLKLRLVAVEVGLDSINEWYATTAPNACVPNCPIGFSVTVDNGHASIWELQGKCCSTDMVRPRNRIVRSEYGVRVLALAILPLTIFTSNFWANAEAEQARINSAIAIFIILPPR